ncbi:MAG: sulfite exporter TauE/SafE family protein [Alphaproteobacteria bacterium]|nr:sulfite exporter TauE/SafE family protein [Alphaproteobacteria bacterium]
MIQDPLFYAFAVPALVVMGISKGAFGSGIGSMLTPLLALTIPPLDAAAIVLPILCAMDVIGIWGYRGKWDGRQLRALVPGACLGITVAALAVGHVDDRMVGLFLGVLAVAFALEWYLRRGNERPATRPHAGRATFWSALSGFTSFVAHAGGPPLQAYLLPQRLDRTVYTATAVLFFTIVNVVKLPPYAALGLFTDVNLWTTLVLLPAAPLGMGLGIWLHAKIPQAPFYRICYAIMLLSGAKLVWDNLGAVA